MSKMNDYQYYRIKDFCKIRSGKRIPKGMDFSELPTKYGYIRARNIKNGRINLDDIVYIDENVKNKIKKYIIEKKDIAITIVGENIGDVGLCPDEGDHYNLTENAVRLTDFDDRVDPEYLCYFLGQSYMKRYMALLGSGAAQGKLGIYKIERIKLPFPDIVVQRKIVEILRGYDSLILTNEKRISILDNIIANIYKEWFVRCRYPGHSSSDNAEQLDWKYQTVADLCEVLQRGISPIYDDEGTLMVISQKCIRTNVMDVSEARLQTKKFKKHLNLIDADTVICSTGTGTLGRVGKVVGDYPNTTFDSHVTLARAKNGISKQFLFGALKNIEPWFMNMGIGSTNQQELYTSVIRKAKILVPDQETMDRYEKLAKPIHDEIGLLIKKNENLIKQRDLLLPRLMSGKLKV